MCRHISPVIFSFLFLVITCTSFSISSFTTSDNCTHACTLAPSPPMKANTSVFLALSQWLSSKQWYQATLSLGPSSWVPVRFLVSFLSAVPLLRFQVGINSTLFSFFLRVLDKWSLPYSFGSQLVFFSGHFLFAFNRRTCLESLSAMFIFPVVNDWQLTFTMSS